MQYDRIQAFNRAFVLHRGKVHFSVTAFRFLRTLLARRNNTITTMHFSLSRCTKLTLPIHLPIIINPRPRFTSPHLQTSTIHPALLSSSSPADPRDWFNRLTLASGCISLSSEHVPSVHPRLSISMGRLACVCARVVVVVEGIRNGNWEMDAMPR